MPIRKCTCDNKFQDARYGSGMRVHNVMKNGNLRCTVCLSEKGKDSTIATGKPTAGGQ